jgi:hypothetical protein
MNHESTRTQLHLEEVARHILVMGTPILSEPDHWVIVITTAQSA